MAVFNPNEPPGIPRGARFKGRTVFHKATELWRAAKAEHDDPENPSHRGAIQRYEAYTDWMSEQYRILADSFEEADRVLANSGLNRESEEGRELFDAARDRFIRERSSPPPVFAIN